MVVPKQDGMDFEPTIADEELYQRRQKRDQILQEL
jgi:hypothetical protein